MKNVCRFLMMMAIFGSLAQALVLENVEFKGLNQLSNESALQISGLKIGQNLDAQSINTAISNLFAQNYFSDIIVTQQANTLIFDFKEKQTIARINITGVASNDRKQIDSILGIKRGYLYDEASVKEAASRIKLFYDSKGYFDTVVETSTEHLSNASGLQLNFIVNRGESITIEKVRLSGSKHLKYGDVEPVIANKEREFLGWLWGRNDGALKIFELPNDSSRISDAYMKEGYLDAKISPAFLKTYTNTYKADLSYFIEEGKRYEIESISVENPLFSEEENQKKVKDLSSRVGKIANIEKIRADIETLQTDTANLGYAYAQVIPDIQKNELEGKVAIHFQVIPNQQVYIRNVIITGNSRTADKIVRRELFVTEGNLYHKSDLEDSTNALRRTSYFDEVNIKEERVDDTHMDLVVEVKEASTGSITGGIGYGSTDGLLLNASLADNNIFGSGMKSIVSVDKSDDYLSGRIGLVNPRLRDSLYSLGGNVYANDYDWNNYSEKSQGFDITIGRQFWRYFSASLTYNLEYDNIYELSDSLILQGYRKGKSVKSSFAPALSFNNTDDYYLPRKGIIASTSLELAGAGGDQKFTSSSSSFNFYQGLKDYIGMDLIYRYKANFYKVWGKYNNGELPINQKIYLGGINSIRGYESRTISPKLRDSNGVPIQGLETGGKIAFNNSVELSFPIIDRIKLRGALFFDYGMIGAQNDLTQIQRYSTGVTLEWITPIGPLQLIFAKPLNKKSYDETNSFEFTLGTRF